MKVLIVFLISLYQIFLSSFLKQLLGARSFCRFSPCCSEYAKEMIERYGIIKGGYYSFFRILQCQPLIAQNSKLKTQNYSSKIKAFKFGL